MPEIKFNVGTITIKRGEYLTVWLRISEHPFHQQQVELRVLKDGTPEIFTKGGDSAPNLRDFKDWTSFDD